jgi:hypothetical protein
MSFRQFGGLQYAARNNFVSSNYNTNNNLQVTGDVGQPNSYINFLSDISGNFVNSSSPIVFYNNLSGSISNTSLTTYQIYNIFNYPNAPIGIYTFSVSCSFTNTDPVNSLNIDKFLVEFFYNNSSSFVNPPYLEQNNLLNLSIPANSTINSTVFSGTFYQSNIGDFNITTQAVFTGVTTSPIFNLLQVTIIKLS